VATTYRDPEEFVRDHRPHGRLLGDATEATESGYLLTVTCPCGVIFFRWLTPTQCQEDILHSKLLAFPN
jgi:hypothetical protein